MRRDEKTFATGGVIVALLAFVVGAWLVGSIAEQRTAIAVAVLLVAGQVGLALWAAGAEERRRRPLAWARVGLVAALFSFIATLAAAPPAVFIGVLAGAGGQPAVAILAVLLAIGVAGAIIWYALRMAWRRTAPKADT